MEIVSFFINIFLKVQYIEKKIIFRVIDFLHSNVFHHKNRTIMQVFSENNPTVESVFCKTNQLPIIKVSNTWFVTCILTVFVRHLCTKWNKFNLCILYIDKISNFVKGLMRLKVVNQTFKDCQNS